jgi:hypothetical protein
MAGVGRSPQVMPWTARRLITNRLVLRPFVDEDTVAVVAMLTDPQVRNYMGGPVDPPDGFSAGAIAEQWGAWCVALSDTGAVVIAVTQTAIQKSMALPSRLRFTEDHRFEEYEAEQSMQSLRRPADWSADIGTTTDR